MVLPENSNSAGAVRPQMAFPMGESLLIDLIVFLFSWISPEEGPMIK